MTDLPDTGKRIQYGEDGAIREDDPDKALVEGISPYAIMRLGSLFTKGHKKYGDFRNWEKGMPITRYIGAIMRHTALYMMRDTREDHLAAIMWNAAAIIHHEEVGTSTGKSFEDIDDRPKYFRKETK